MKALMGFEPAHNGKINVCSAASDSIFWAIQDDIKQFSKLHLTSDLYKIVFVIFQEAGVRTPATSSGSARGIVNWARPHIVLIKRLSMTLTTLMQVLCGCGKQRQGPTV